LHLVQVRCPYCSSKGYISVSEDNLNNAKKGLLTINVSSVCVHTFFIYVDKNFDRVREEEEFIKIIKNKEITNG